jgi:putative ABC transport system permease protein
MLCARPIPDSSMPLHQTGMPIMAGSRRRRKGDLRGLHAREPNNWKQVIGVVSGLRHAALDGPPPLNVYLAGKAFEQAAFLVIRTERPVGEVDKAVRRAIAKVDPDQAVLLSTSMETLVQESVADRPFMIHLLGVTGYLALLYLRPGVFGVTSYMTSCRTQEIGVRMALGATPGSVHALVFRDGFSAVCAGLALGKLA